MGRGEAELGGEQSFWSRWPAGLGEQMESRLACARCGTYPSFVLSCSRVVLAGRLEKEGEQGEGKQEVKGRTRLDQCGLFAAEALLVKNVRQDARTLSSPK